MDHQLKKHHKNNPIPSPFTQFYSSKKAIQILFSLSLFSFLFSQSSLLPFLFPSFSIRLFNYSTDRNYIFLLCNGILLLIIKNSGLFATAPSDTEFRDEHIQSIVHSDESKDLKNYDVKKNDQSRQSSVPEVLSGTKSEIIQVVEAESKISAIEEDDENVISSSAHSEVEEEDKDEEGLLLKIVKREDEDKGDQLLNFVEEENEGDEFLDIKEKEEENEGLLSAEELNKKCDDFIRKMKDGIKIEAQHLIMVYCQG